MQQMLKQMGIVSKELNASRVIIETEGERLIILNPQIIAVNMQGKTSYQISGEVIREFAVKEEDIKMVMEQAKCNEEQAKEALRKFNGDIAQAILDLSAK